MADNTKREGGMLQTLINGFKNKEIRTKILITLGLLFVYRIGAYIPIPGIAPGALAGGGNTLLELLSALTGGALANGAIFAIGVAPYINASIIMQLLTVAIPKLEQWQKQGDEGKKKLNNVTRIVTFVLAIAQATAIAVSLGITNNGDGIYPIFGAEANLNWLIAMFIAVVLVAGAMLVMWIGERITEKGIGNGVSLLIFVGILSTAGLSIMAEGSAAAGGDEFAIWRIIGFLFMVVIVFGFIVFIDLAERRIPIQYAKQIKGRKQYGGQSTFIPIKVNAAGVLPIIFANAIITFPQLIFSFVPATGDVDSGWTRFMTFYQNHLGVGTPVYIVLTGLLIFFFSFFYAQIQFNPEEVARNIQQHGGFVPGIRPGKPTQEYLTKLSRRMTFWGALFLAIIAIVPSAIFAAVLGETSILLTGFTATGMLIVVSVALEFEKQLQSQLMMKQYKGFLK